LHFQLLNNGLGPELECTACGLHFMGYQRKMVKRIPGSETSFLDRTRLELNFLVTLGT